MATFKVNDVDEARFIAKMVGFVPSNEGQRGAFPIRQLSAFLAGQGHKLDITDYVSGVSTKVDPVYWVAIAGKIGEDEQGNPIIAPRYAQIALSEVREITGKTGRGKPGFNDIISAVVHREQWTPSGLKSSFEVTRLN